MFAVYPFADLVLLGWIPLTLAGFLVFRPPVACTLAVVGALLLLPSRHGIHFQGVPDLTRDRVAILGCVVGCLLFAPNLLRVVFLRSSSILLLPLALTLGVVVTGLGNRAPVDWTVFSVPGMGLKDLVSFATIQVLDFSLPFLLGFCLFRQPRDLRFLVRLLAVAGLAYSLLILWEVRMSPSIHRMVYGFHPQSFLQTYRLGGWRPAVFLPHGLALALFVFSSTVAATGLARAGLALLPERGGPRGRSADRGALLSVAGSAYLCVVLVLCRSLAAMLYGLFAVPLVALARPRTQLRAALLLAGLVLLYPALRVAGWFPTDVLVAAARPISAQRADSLEFRFENEDRLVDRALEKPLFGWGSWGRNRVFDRDTGKDLSVTDGFWIIVLGNQGLTGFVCAFGMLLAPIHMASRATRRLRARQHRALFAALALILAITAVDLLPNGFLFAWHLYLAGAVAGLSVGVPRSVARARARARQPVPASA